MTRFIWDQQEYEGPDIHADKLGTGTTYSRRTKD